MQTRYINTASTAGGNGTTNATSGANRAYASLAEWEAARQGTLTEVEEVICEGNTPDASCTVDGWTTSASYYILIRTTQANRHDGTSGTGYRLSVGAYENGLTISEDYVRVEGIAFVNGGLANRFIYLNNASTLDVRIDACIFSGGSIYPQLDITSMSGGTIVVRNCVFDLGAASGRGVAVGSSGGTVYLYNNTYVTSLADNGYYDAAYGRTGTSTVVARNCIAVSTGVPTNWSCFSGTYDSSSSNNVSSDGTAPGSSSKTGVVPSFVSSTNFDLQSSDTVARDSGADLSGVANFPFSVDILGNARSGTWDIGAFEYQSAAVASLPPKSITSLTAVRRAAFH